jgi:hypothetical protein
MFFIITFKTTADFAFDHVDRRLSLSKLVLIYLGHLKALGQAPTTFLNTEARQLVVITPE